MLSQNSKQIKKYTYAKPKIKTNNKKHVLFVLKAMFFNSSTFFILSSQPSRSSTQALISS